MATETDTAAQIASLEQQVYELNQQLAALQKTHPGTEVPNYTFSTQSGSM